MLKPAINIHGTSSASNINAVNQDKDQHHHHNRRSSVKVVTFNTNLTSDIKLSTMTLETAPVVTIEFNTKQCEEYQPEIKEETVENEESPKKSFVITPH